MKSYYTQCGHVVNEVCMSVCLFAVRASPKSIILLWVDQSPKSVLLWILLCAYTSVSRNRRKLRVSLHTYIISFLFSLFSCSYIFRCRFGRILRYFVRTIVFVLQYRRRLVCTLIIVFLVALPSVHFVCVQWYRNYTCEPTCATSMYAGKGH